MCRTIHAAKLKKEADATELHLKQIATFAFEFEPL
jgi:hypothetical protein